MVYRLVEPTQRATPERDRTFICPAVLGPPAGLMGAALLPVLAAPAGAPERNSRHDSARDSNGVPLQDNTQTEQIR